MAWKKKENQDAPQAYRIDPETALKYRINELIIQVSAVKGELYKSNLNGVQQDVKFYGGNVLSLFETLLTLVRAQKPTNDWGRFDRFLTEVAVFKTINAVQIGNMVEDLLKEMSDLGMLGEEDVVLEHGFEDDSNVTEAGNEDPAD